jgi:hypothetical protein
MTTLRPKFSRRARRWIGVYYHPCRLSVRLALCKIKLGCDPDDVDLEVGRKNIRVRYW